LAESDPNSPPDGKGGKIVVAVGIVLLYCDVDKGAMAVRC